MPQSEALLVKGLLEIKESRMNSALAKIEAALKISPNFRLAQLIKGDLLTARTQTLTSLGNAATGMGDKIDDLRDEAKAHLLRYKQDIPRNEIPKYLVQLNHKQKYAIVVDMSRSTLFLYENQNGNMRYVSDYYVSIGKNGVGKEKEGDKKTPAGVYYIVNKVPDQLASLYGIGAFSLNYPNEWDKREGRKGHGIWLHGAPSDTYSRPPRASDGCIVLTNQDLKALEKNIQAGLTPIILAKNIKWSSTKNVARTRGELQTKIEGWRGDWESLNTPNYLEHYAQEFLADNKDLSGWAKHKYRVNSTKSWAKIKLDQVNIFLYPGRDDMAVVDFDQDYTSSNFTHHMKKRQYWIMERGHWKIIYEGAA